MRPSSAATKSATDLLPCPVLGDDSADSRECVLDAMVELGQQSALLFLHPFALGYVNADADDSVWVSSAAKGKETARLDPSQLATRTNRYDTLRYIRAGGHGTPRCGTVLPFLCRQGARQPGIRCVLSR